MVPRARSRPGKPSLQKAAREYLDRKAPEELQRLLGQKTRLWQTHKQVQDTRRNLSLSGLVAPGRNAWNREEEALLGTGPDEVISRQLKRTLHAVRYHRSQLGIPVFGGIGHQWTAAQDKLLRMHPAKIVAQLLKITKDIVYLRRRKLGIFGRLPWKPKEVALLGTMSDQELARKMKRSLGAVRHHRIQRGIRAFGHRFQHQWTRAEKSSWAATRTIKWLKGWASPLLRSRYGVPGWVFRNLNRSRGNGQLRKSLYWERCPMNKPPGARAERP